MNKILIEFKDSMPGSTVMVEWHNSITDCPAVWNQDLYILGAKRNANLSNWTINNLSSIVGQVLHCGRVHLAAHLWQSFNSVMTH